MTMIFKTKSFQVKETYNGTVEPSPSYISTMASPMRRRHRDDILVTKTTVGVHSKLFAPFHLPYL